MIYKPASYQALLSTAVAVNRDNCSLCQLAKLDYASLYHYKVNVDFKNITIYALKWFLINLTITI